MEDNLPSTLDDIPAPPPTVNIGQKIILFGTPTCPDCARIKKFLADNAIEYEYHDLSVDKEANKWLTSFAKFVPVLIMSDKTMMYEPTNQELLEKLQAASLNQKVAVTEPEVFDTIIIGGGPAGLSAAIYAVRKALKILVITKDIGGQATFSGDVENYLGFTMINGADLVNKFRESVERFKEEGIWIKEGVEVTDIISEDSTFTVKAGNREYKGKTLIIASGRIPRKLKVPGEDKLWGKGVATCATCDAPLFKGKNVAVVGGGNSALDAAFSLIKFASKVTIVNNTDEIKGDSVLLEKVNSAQNVQVINNSQVLEIQGTDGVEALTIKDSKNSQATTLPVSGVFVEIGYTPSTGFDKITDKDDKGCIIVNEFGQSSVDGIWAAGDVNNLWGEQIIIAAGEGAKVALAVSEHLSKSPHQTTSKTVFLFP